MDVRANGGTPAGPRPDLDDVTARDALGRATDEEAAWLRRPENLEVWREALVALLQMTERSQMRSREKVIVARQKARTRQQYCEAMKEHARRSARATYFRQQVQARLTESKRLIHRAATLADEARRRTIADRFDMLERENELLRAQIEGLDLRREVDQVAS